LGGWTNTGGMYQKKRWFLEIYPNLDKSRTAHCMCAWCLKLGKWGLFCSKGELKTEASYSKGPSTNG